jgi:hypothetical protein
LCLFINLIKNLMRAGVEVEAEEGAAAEEEEGRGADQGALHAGVQGALGGQGALLPDPGVEVLPKQQRMFSPLIPFPSPFSLASF